MKVKIWFQNRRMKWRNSKERELLSSGGSRESTLPNKSNPNPDLSDVAEGKRSPEAHGQGHPAGLVAEQGSDMDELIESPGSSPCSSPLVVDQAAEDQDGPRSPAAVNPDEDYGEEERDIDVM